MKSYEGNQRRVKERHIAAAMEAEKERKRFSISEVTLNETCSEKEEPSLVKIIEQESGDDYERTTSNQVSETIEESNTREHPDYKLNTTKVPRPSTISKDIDHLQEAVEKSLKLYKAQKEQGKHKWQHTVGKSTSDTNEKVISTELSDTVRQTEVPTQVLTKREISIVGTKPTPTWSEKHDFRLAELVHEHIFDFNIVADILSKECEGETNVFSADDCRYRWSTLDSYGIHEVDKSQRVQFQTLHMNNKDGSRIAYEDLQNIPSEIVKISNLPNMLDGNEEDENKIFTRSEIISSLKETP